MAEIRVLSETELKALPIPPAFRPGCPVVVAAPDFPKHYRKGQTGLVASSSWYQNTKRKEAPKLFVFVDFATDVVEGGKNYGNIQGYFWSTELRPGKKV